MCVCRSSVFRGAGILNWMVGGLLFSILGACAVEAASEPSALLSHGDASTAPPVEHVAPINEPGIGTSRGFHAVSRMARQADADPIFALSEHTDLVAVGRNPAHDFELSFDGLGAILRWSNEETDELRLELSAWGRGDRLDAPPRVSESRVDEEGFGVRYERGRALTEWYLNGPVGLEQGFELRERVSGDGALVLAIRFGGLLAAELTEEGVALRDAGGELRAHYGHLYVFDADGREVASHMERRSDGLVALVIEDEGARYPLTVDPFVWTTGAPLLPAGGGAGEFGDAIVIDGNTAIIGAPTMRSAPGVRGGAAFIFERDAAGRWVQRAQWVAPGGGGIGWAFGADVDLEGDVAIVGDSTAGHIYRRDSLGVWRFEQTLLIAGGSRRTGSRVGVSGDLAVLGHVGGAVAFHRGAGGTWAVEATLLPTARTVDEIAYSGCADPSLSLSGQTLFYGCPVAAVHERYCSFDICFGCGCPENCDTDWIGAVFVYERDAAGRWTDTTILTSPLGNPSLCQDTDGALFGAEVSVEGNRAIVSEPDYVSYGWDCLDDPSVSGSIVSRCERMIPRGRVHVYDRTATGAWGFSATVGPPRDISCISFGESLSLDGDAFAVGSAVNQGRECRTRHYPAGRASYPVESFRRSAAGTWFNAETLRSADSPDDDAFGLSVAVSGDHLLVGAPHGTTRSGRVGGIVYSFRSRAAALLPNGSACGGSGECSSGFCIDGVCCDTACGMESPWDCMACSSALTGGRDGVCAPAARGFVCRAAGIDHSYGWDPECDAAEVCDGASLDCPRDWEAMDGTACRIGAGPCGVDGMCRWGSCETGGATALGRLCRPAVDACDLRELCDGIGDACPVDRALADGTSCADGMACNGEEVCMAGACTAPVGFDCDDGDPCTADMCAEPSGCVHVPIVGCAPDGGVPDGGVPDGSVPDGSVPDGSVPDGSVPDGSVPDGSVPDGSVPDAGPMTPDASGPGGGSDSGCSVLPGARPTSTAALFFFAVLLGFVLRRNRRRCGRHSYPIGVGAVRDHGLTAGEPKGREKLTLSAGEATLQA